MNHHGSDLNSNLLLDNPAPQTQPIAPQSIISLLNPSSNTTREIFPLGIARSLKDSINYNAALVLFSLSKIIASIWALATTELKCDKPLREWVMYLVAHDGIYATLLIMKIKTMLRNSLIQQENSSQQTEQNSSNESSGESNFAISEEADRKNKFVSALFAVCKAYYYALFIYSQIIYFQFETNCKEVSPVLYKLGFVYIIFAYIYIGMPIAFIGLACIGLPFLIFLSFVSSKGKQVPVPKDILKNIPVILFSPDLPGAHECSICIGAYKEKDRLIQLRCSPLHHYHEECLKKWLKINGLCPICRTRIEDDKTEKSNMHVEMTSANQNDN